MSNDVTQSGKYYFCNGIKFACEKDYKGQGFNQREVSEIAPQLPYQTQYPPWESAKISINGKTETVLIESDGLVKRVQSNPPVTLT